jgi:PLP dependent protein
MLFPDLADRVTEVRERITGAVRRGGHGQSVTVIAVTKTFGADAVRESYAVGLRDVGENKVQEAVRKQEEVSEPLRWHLIGHLQRNKVKALETFDLFHALDSARLADAIDGWAQGAGRIMPVLVQVNVSGEATKGGWPLDALPAEAERLRALTGLRVDGVMTMAPFDSDEGTLRACFAGARAARTILQDAGHPAEALSMGMSQDFEIAVEEGATLVRLGTTLFGARH